MFQLLVVTAGLTLANCQESPRIIETSYKDGKEYIYDYESQVLSGLPQGAKTWSGLKLQSQVLIQTDSPWKVKLQMRSPRLYKVNDLLDSQDPTKEMLPVELFKELLDDESEDMKLHLLKPVVFSYVRGHIEDLTTEEDDPEWSVNIKRGMLSLLEINFNERQSLTKDVPVLLSDSEPKVYKVIEPSVVGECETRYRVQPERSEEDVPSMSVQKLRDYNRCLEKVVLTQDILNGRACDLCNKLEQLNHVSAQSSVKYHLLGSPDKFIILNAMSESQYSFIPYSTEAGSMSTFSNQTLTLVDSRPISDQIKEPRSPLHHDRPLKAKTQDSESSPLSPRTLKLKKEEKTELKKKIEKVLAGIEQLMKDQVNEEVGELLSELTRLLKKMDKHSLNSLFDDILRDPMKLPKSRKVVVDILPSVGTYPAVDVLLERIENEDIPKDSAPLAFMTLSLLPKPDVFIVKRLMDYVEKKQMKEQVDDRMLHRSAWLTLGSLGDKMIQVSMSSMKDKDSEREIVDQLRSESNDRQIRKKLDKRLEEIDNKRLQTKELYTTAKKKIIEMVQKLYENDNEDCKRLAVKVMANLQYEEFSPTLETLVKDMEKPELARIDALDSLLYIVKENSEKVEKIFLPLSMDRRQPDIIRMIAFNVVAFASHHRSAMEMIVKSLEDDPNDNVGNYVYSALLEFSKLSTPCDELKELAENSSLAQRYAKKSPHPNRKSSVYAGSSYDELLRIGHTYLSAMMYSPMERSPSYYSAGYTVSLLGKSSDVLQVTYSGKGLDSVLDKLLTASADTSLETVLKTVLHPRQRRSTVSDYEQKIKDIKEKIGVKTREPEKPEHYFGVRLFGHVLIYFDASSLLTSPVETSSGDNEMLESLKEKLSLLDNLKSLLKSQKSLVLPLLHMSVPTDMGLPLKVHVDKRATLKIDGELKLTSDPRNSMKKSLISKMDALLKVRPSALIELEGRMEVDMKYIRCGVTVKGKVYTDVPLSLSVNVDPENSKLLIKLKDEKELIPLKLESHAHTEIRRLPPTADKYPIPPERKEITIIDGVDSKVVSYEVGKDILGRSIKMIGMRSIRKDKSIPLPPMSGQQVIHVRYEPLPGSSLNIQMQHVRDSDSAMSLQSDEARGGSSWFSLSSWFPSSKGSREERDPSSREASSDSSEERDDAAKQFVDLEVRDLSIKYLKSKFTKETDILEAGIKCGLVVRIAGSSPEPKHEVQLSTLYQHSERKVSYTVELIRTPRPDEDKPWKMVTDIRLDLPERNLEPSDLLDNEYQKQVQEKIRISVPEDGKELDSLLDLGSEVIRLAAKHIKKIQKPDSVDDIIEDSVNHVLQNSVNPDSKPLTDAVQKQRKILRDVAKLSRQPAYPEKIKELLETLKNILKRSKLVTEEVSKKLDQTLRRDQKPEDSVQVLYLLIIKEKTYRKLMLTAEKMRPVLLQSEKSELETKLKEQVHDLEGIKDQQRKHSIDKQSSELQKSRIEIEPRDRSLHSKLLDLEQKLISLSKTMSKELKEGRTIRSIDSSKSQIKEIDEVSRDVKDKLDVSLLENSKLDKMLRVKVLEVLLHQKQALIDLEKDIKSLEKKSRTIDPSSLKTQEDNLTDNLKRELVKLKEDLVMKAKEIARRLAIAIDAEKERKSMNLHVSPENAERLATMVKIHVKQLQVLEDLNLKQPFPIHGIRKQPSKESVQKAVEGVKEDSRKIMDIIDKESRDIKAERKTLLSPMLIKSWKALSRQYGILEKIKEIAKDKIVTEAVNGGSDLMLLKKLKKETEQLQHDTVKNIRTTENLLKRRDPSRPDSVSLDLSPLPSYPSKDVSAAITVMLKRAMKVEVHHSEVRPLQKKLMLSLDQPTPADRLSKVAKNVHEKQMLYDIISKLLASQDELDRVQKPLDMKVKEDPSSEQLQDLLKVVTEKQENQFSIVKAVEKRLIVKSRSDLSLLQPLQTIQQLKDRVQRQQHETKLLQQSSSSTSPRHSHHTLSLSTSASPRSPRQPIYTGMVKISYGEEYKQRKSVTIRLFGKKSLQQLLWEKDQALPSKQDPALRRYLSDRREPDDPTARDYRMIKDKLNMFRHLHALVAYEDSLPNYVKELMWKLREMLKLKLHNKVELIMPDDTNMKNKVEIKAELSQDDRWTDVEIKSPSETTRIRNIPTPGIVKRVSLSDSIAHTALSSISTRHLPASCEITPYRVKMLSGKTVEVNLRNQHVKVF
ncbi:uncharacterized protein LOC123525183 [Mercenaria mercenaria]|uniref:uncharacterized protein LOC123525183 n=1 Tax=Mercenaria mercenaria TaxID=6596 RepID=UPI00234EC280|nr:uncharacterized protein LOC123525183 [Mercenaria mercenaria]